MLAGLESRHSLWIGIGGALLVVGVGGIIALVASSQTSQRWFFWVVVALAVVAVVGLYGLFGPILGLPMRGPRTQPFWRSGRPVLERRSLERTPEELAKMFENLTDMQAQRLVAPFIGEWLEVSGSLRSVSAARNHVQVMFEGPPAGGWGGYVQMYFSAKEWSRRLGLLNRGDRISIRGRIGEIHSFGVLLGDCELVDKV
jgi:hypothetical protein